jgi:hypothetical protein
LVLKTVPVVYVERAGVVVERCVSGVEDPLAFEEVAGGCGWSSVREEDGVEEREEEREEDEPWEEVGE